MQKISIIGVDLQSSVPKTDMLTITLYAYLKIQTWIRGELTQLSQPL